MATAQDKARSLSMKEQIPTESRDEHVSVAAAGADQDDGPTTCSTGASKDEAEAQDRQTRGRGQDRQNAVKFMTIFRGLSWADRLLPLFVIVAMILGVVLGEFVPDIKPRLTEQATLLSVPAPLSIGLVIMMWPILTKVQYELLPSLVTSRKLWTQIGVSLVLNWLIGPFLMLGLAWATLPDLPTYRNGVILVGAARCIAMVMIWVGIAQGDCNICACIVVVNALLQIVGYAPLCLLLINVISNADNLALQYGKTALSVLIYLGIPLVSGVMTRFGVRKLVGRRRFEQHFVPVFGLLSLVALLYVIIVIFASQARQILENIGPVFRTVVPLVVYFALMWTMTFVAVWRWTLRNADKAAAASAATIAPSDRGIPDDVQVVPSALGEKEGSDKDDGPYTYAAAPVSKDQPIAAAPLATWGYDMAVVQSFTAASNNFELAIAIAVATYGADSKETLGATIGPLVEVPVLLLLSYVALFLGHRLRWRGRYIAEAGTLA